MPRDEESPRSSPGLTSVPGKMYANVQYPQCVVKPYTCNFIPGGKHFVCGHEDCPFETISSYIFFLHFKRVHGVAIKAYEFSVEKMLTISGHDFVAHRYFNTGTNRIFVDFIRCLENIILIVEVDEQQHRGGGISSEIDAEHDGRQEKSCRPRRHLPYLLHKVQPRRGRENTGWCH